MCSAKIGVSSAKICGKRKIRVKSVRNNLREKKNPCKICANNLCKICAK